MRDVSSSTVVGLTTNLACRLAAPKCRRVALGSMKTYVDIYLALCWLFGAGGVLDALITSRKRFAAAGESKLRWVLIELAGLPFLGIFTFWYYRLKIRPRLGGPGARYRSSSFAGGGRRRSGHSASRSGAGGSQSSSAAAREPCNNCQERGWNYESAPGSAWGQRQVTCSRCSGHGYL